MGGLFGVVSDSDCRSVLFCGSIMDTRHPSMKRSTWNMFRYYCGEALARNDDVEVGCGGR